MRYIVIFCIKPLLIYFIVFIILYFFSLHCTPPQATARTELTIGYCYFTIFLNRQCVYFEILLYIVSFNLCFHPKFGLKFNLEVVLKSLKKSYI